MFPFHRAALRLASSSSRRYAAVNTRTISSFRIQSLRVAPQSLLINVQKRWASDDVEAKKEEVPISKLQPTSQEEVENVISEENASKHVDSAATENVNAAEATEEVPSISSRLRTVAASVLPGSSTRGPRDEQSPFSVARNNDPKETVYIGNLFFDVTEDDLTREMARFGTISRIRLIRDARGLSKGFGYVTFETIEQATKAIEDLNQQLFEGRRVTVQYASSNSSPVRATKPEHRPTNPPSKTLFIGNMSWEMTDRDLNNLFRGIRNVIDVRVAIDRRTGQPRGFAHADFVDVKSAQEAMKVLADKETYGRRLRLDYSYGPSYSAKTEAKDAGQV